MLVAGINRQTLQADAIQSLISYGTLAGQNVFQPRAWPDTVDKLPMIIVQTPRERKEGIGRNLREFYTVMSLAVVGRVASKQESIVNASLDTLSQQIDDAIISSALLMDSVQMFRSVQSEMVVTAESLYFVGEVGFIFDAEILQIYGPNTGVPLTDIRGTITDLSNNETLTVVDAPLGGFVFGVGKFGEKSF